MSNFLDLFHHIFLDTGSSRVVVAFHGTGADEHDLVPLIQRVAPNTSILSLRGNVQERGMNRFFERYPDGTFNVENIHHELQKLRQFLDTWLEEHDHSYEELVFLGYSNGANFSLSFLLHQSPTITNAALLHPSLPPLPSTPPDLSSRNILLTSGVRDEYLSAEKYEKLTTFLEATRAELTLLQHEGGHELRAEELQAVMSFLST